MCCEGSIEEPHVWWGVSTEEPRVCSVGGSTEEPHVCVVEGSTEEPHVCVV